MKKFCIYSKADRAQEPKEFRHGGRVTMKRDDVRNFRRTEQLRNGTEVTIRAIRPDDKELLVAAFKELDESTIYTRFFAPKKDITGKELKWATEVDFFRNVALVACVGEGGQEKIIGIGRYIAEGESDPPSSAEIAFVVEEDYQGLGLASILFKHLASIGRDQGLSRFEAEVLPSNRAMLKVFGRAGLPMTTTQAEDSIHVVLSLNQGGAE
jgi:RimJ/RimL family protein N-acetyltransferase